MIGKALLNLDQATMHLDPTSPRRMPQDNVSEIPPAASARPGVVAAAIEMKEFTPPQARQPGSWTPWPKASSGCGSMR